MSTPFSPRVSQVLTLSREAAGRLGTIPIGPELLLLGLLRGGKGSALRMIAQLGVRVEDLHPQLEPVLEEVVPTGPGPADESGLTPEAANVLYLAGREARFWGADQVETMHLLLALLRDENSRLCRLLDRHGITYQPLFDMAAYDRVGLRYGQG